MIKNRRLPLIDVLRLGLFQGCVGCMGYVFGGLLNRVMKTELDYPGVIVGGVLAIEQIMALSRVLFGQVSDRYSIGGWHRIPYLWLGTAIFCGLALLVVPVIFELQTAMVSGNGVSTASWIAVLSGIIALYGLGVSLATTPFLALVIDRTSEEERPQAIGIIWCMLLIGVIIGGISGKISLSGVTDSTDLLALQPILFDYLKKVVVAVLVLTLIGTWGLEPRKLNRSLSADREDSVTLSQSWGLITSSRQIVVFAFFLFAFTLAVFIQDPVLESYGAEVFQMTISESSSLTINWGCGVLIGLLFAGSLVVPKIGKLATARLGCRLILLSMLLLMAAGLSGGKSFLLMVTVVFGLACGIGTNGSLSLMLDFTLPQAAGAFVGVWGLTQAYGRAVAKFTGGILLDAGQQLNLFFNFGNETLTPYLLVLGIEALAALAALILASNLKMAQFKNDTGKSLSEVQAIELG